MDTAFYYKIRQLCESKNISLVKMQTDLGFSSSAVKAWKNGTAPAADRVMKIATYFNVSTDYLLGATDIPSPIEKYIDENADIISLQRARAKMTSKDKERMMQMIRIGFDYAFEDSDNTDE